MCVCTHVFRIKMQNIQSAVRLQQQTFPGVRNCNLNWENSFKSVATSLTAQDNDDDTILSKPLAADKSLCGMHKNSFLNGHKGVHIRASAIVSAKIENLSKGWKVTTQRIFLFRHSTQAKLLYFVFFFVAKVTMEGKILLNVFPPRSHFLFHQSRRLPATVCIHTSWTLFCCFKSSLFLLRNELFWAKLTLHIYKCTGSGARRTARRVFSRVTRGTQLFSGFSVSSQSEFPAENIFLF